MGYWRGELGFSGGAKVEVNENFFCLNSQPKFQAALSKKSFLKGIEILRQRRRERERDTQRERQRQRDRETHGQTDLKTDTV